MPEPIDDFDDGKTPVPHNVDEFRQVRHVDERISKVEIGLSAYVQSFARLEASVDEFVKPAVKQLMGQLDLLLRRQERIDTRLETFFEDQWPRLVDAVDQLVERLARVEKKQDEFHTALAAHHDRIARAEKALELVEIRLGVVERRLDDAALTSNVVKAERRRLLSYVLNAKAAFAAGASVVTLVIARWSDIVAFFK